MAGTSVRGSHQPNGWTVGRALVEARHAPAPVIEQMLEAYTRVSRA